MNKKLFDTSSEFRNSIEGGFKIDLSMLDNEHHRRSSTLELSDGNRNSTLQITGRESRLDQQSTNEEYGLLPNPSSLLRTETDPTAVEASLKKMGEIQSMYENLFLDEMKRELGKTQEKVVLTSRKNHEKEYVIIKGLKQHNQQLKMLCKRFKQMQDQMLQDEKPGNEE